MSDINELRINLGNLDRFIDLAERSRPYSRQTLISIMSLVDEQALELEAFLADVRETAEKARRVCHV